MGSLTSLRFIKKKQREADKFFISLSLSSTSSERFIEWGRNLGPWMSLETRSENCEEVGRKPRDIIMK